MQVAFFVIPCKYTELSIARGPELSYLIIPGEFFNSQPLVKVSSPAGVNTVLCSVLTC